MENIRFFCLKIFIFLVVKVSVYLNRHVFVMKQTPHMKLQRNDEQKHLRGVFVCVCGGGGGGWGRRLRGGGEDRA